MNTLKSDIRDVEKTIQEYQLFR